VTNPAPGMRLYGQPREPDNWPPMPIASDAEDWPPGTGGQKGLRLDESSTVTVLFVRARDRNELPTPLQRGWLRGISERATGAEADVIRWLLKLKSPTTG
jgi:hypothetical protein